MLPAKDITKIKIQRQYFCRSKRATEENQRPFSIEKENSIGTVRRILLPERLSIDTDCEGISYFAKSTC